MTHWRLPKWPLLLSRELMRIAPGKQGIAPLRIPNSIDNLSDRDPFVQLSSGLTAITDAHARQ